MALRALLFNYLINGITFKFKELKMRKKLFLYLDIDETLGGNKDHEYIERIYSDTNLSDRQKLQRIHSLYWNYYPIVNWDDFEVNDLGSLIPERAIRKFKELYCELDDLYDVWVVGVSAWFGSSRKDNKTICERLGVNFDRFIYGENYGAGGPCRDEHVAKMVSNNPEAIHLILDDQCYSKDLERFRIVPTLEWGYTDNQWSELLALANNQY